MIDFISGVVHHYGVPHSIFTDNGTNFTANEVKSWCKNMGIKLDYALVYHPQTNGQVERANGLIMSGIKPRLVRCHAQYATLSKRNSKVPPRIDPHIETLLQGGYHYINIT